jgi:hypothetical protein
MTNINTVINLNIVLLLAVIDKKILKRIYISSGTIKAKIFESQIILKSL